MTSRQMEWKYEKAGTAAREAKDKSRSGIALTHSGMVKIRTGSGYSRTISPSTIIYYRGELGGREGTGAWSQKGLGRKKHRGI